MPLRKPAVAGFFVGGESEGFPRLTSPVFIPLGGFSVYAAWRAQYLRRLAGPVFIPLGGPSIYPAWRTQCLSRLARLVFIPLDGASIDAAWRVQCLSRLAGSVFIPLGGPSWRYMHQRYNTLTPVCRYRRDRQSNTGSSSFSWSQTESSVISATLYLSAGIAT